MTYIYLLGTYFLVKFFISIFRCFYYILLGGGRGRTYVLQHIVEVQQQLAGVGLSTMRGSGIELRSVRLDTGKYFSLLSHLTNPLMSIL